MAVGIIIHISVGEEKRTEFFNEERIRFGSDETSDLQIHTRSIPQKGVLFEIEWDDNQYRLINYNEEIELTHNDEPLRRYTPISDGDVINIEGTNISFSFFSLASESALITTNREQTHVAPFIEDAAVEAAATPKRDDAKAFLREFLHELSREISWTTKLIVLALGVGLISGIFYLGFAVNSELKKNREEAEKQNRIIRDLQAKIVETNDQVSEIDKKSEEMQRNLSLVPNLRIDYGDGICLIVGVYDLVDRRSGKVLRYPDPQSFEPEEFDPSLPPAADQDKLIEPQMQMGLTTVGNGSPVEYDFIGTGFHVGGGYIVTNRHVVQPWKEDDLVMQMMRDANGRARIRRLVVYFPSSIMAFPLRVRQIDTREDIAVGTVDPEVLPAGIPVLPVASSRESVAVGKTVVTMGYPNGPDRILAMVDDEEAKSLNRRFGGSRQALINYLAKSKKIVPLTTQGAITDLDSRRIVHDAKTAEGGSGAPLFGPNAKVIGVNFGVFTGNNAANMAVPIRFAVSLLKRAGWKDPQETDKESVSKDQTASTNAPDSKKKNP